MTEDPIGSLLRATGRRVAVPEERSARVREAARVAWQREVGRRRRRRRIAGGLALAAAVLVAVWVARSFRSPHVPLAAAPLVVERSDGLTELQGSTLRTGADGRAALRARGGQALRLDHDTTLRILSDRSFRLERGAVYVDVLPGAAPLRIETPRAVVEERGTQFQVRLSGGDLAVRVREGAVAVTAGSASVLAAAGQAVTVDGGGRIARTADAAAGWEWTEAIAPPFLLEGRSLADFLAWAARERGARVRFLDPALAGRAPGIVLHGSIDGMTLDQAVASVTATSGLVHRWDRGELVVGAAP